MSALLKDDNIINNLNNINTSLIKGKSVKNFKKELKFMDILKEKVIKRIKALNYNNNFNNKALILNLSAFEHYTAYKDILLNYKPINHKSIIITNGVKSLIKGIGHILVFINKETFLIKNVNYILNIKVTLISFKELTNKGQEILFKEDKAILSYKNKNIINVN